MAYRSTVQESTGFFPNRLMLGREVTLPIELMIGVPKGNQQSLSYSQYVYQMSNNILSSFELARSHSSAAQQRQKRNYDTRIHSTGAPFQEGDKVWLARSHRTKGRSPKLDMRWDGPFVIVNKFSDCIYRIKHCATGKKKGDTF